MAASIRIEDEAFSDIRIEMLAELAGYANRFESLGRMAWLWRTCTQRGVCVVSESVVIACMGDNIDALVRAELAEVVEDGIRIKGTEGRIEWLANKRKAAKKGAEATKEKWKASATPLGLADAVRLPGPPVTAPVTVTVNKERRKRDVVSSEAGAAATRLASKIQQRDPQAKTSPGGWGQDLDKLHRIDGRSWEQISRVIDWCQADLFWQRNILSGKKLREKFTQLVAAMPSAPGQTPVGPPLTQELKPYSMDEDES